MKAVRTDCNDKKKAAIERQVIVTWYTPEEKTPPEDCTVALSFSGTDKNRSYINALGTGMYWEDIGWYIVGLSNAADFYVHKWCDLEP